MASIKVFVAALLVVLFVVLPSASSGTLPERYWTGITSDATGQYLAATSEMPYQLYTSSDFGANWDFRCNITINYLASDSSGAMIVGIGARIVYISYDFGATFTNTTISMDNPEDYLANIAMSSSGEVIYTHALGSFLRSNDSGKSFLNISTFPEPLGIYSMATNAEGNFVAISSYSVGILTSFDFGVTFTLVNTALYGDLTSMSLDSTGQQLLGGSLGGAYLSTNYGVNWTALTVGPGNNQYEYGCSSNDGRVLHLSTVNGGYVFVSFDGGASWNTTSPYGNYMRIACNDAGSEAAVAYYHGGVLMISDQPPPTSQPSSQPTSRPSCQAGSGSSSGGCAECGPGSYLTSLGGVCEVCPVGFFSSSAGASHCSDCPYPTTTVFDQSSACDALSLSVSLRTTLVLTGCLLFVVVVCCLFTSTKATALLLTLLLPALDLLSNLAYLLTSDFYSPAIFVLAALSLLSALPSFLLLLVRNGAALPARLTWRLKRVWWLSAGQREQDHIYFAKFPCFGGDERFPLLSCAKHDNLLSLTCEGVVWLIAIVSQILTIVGYPFLILANVVYLICWFFLGLFLYSAKCLAVGGVWNLWFAQWSGVSDHDTVVEVDTELLNAGLLHELVLESLPQLVLQVVNSLLIRRFTPVAVFSISLSAVMSLIGLLRFGYYYYCSCSGGKRLSLRDLPVGVSLTVGDTLLLDGRIHPCSKRDKGVDPCGDVKEDVLSESLLINVIHVGGDFSRYDEEEKQQQQQHQQMQKNEN